MANNGFTSLADIRPFKTSWRIQVKIVHTWKQYTQYTGKTIEMILADASGTLIHATVKRPQVNKFQSTIVAGAWRVIENFTLSKSMEKYRATKHAYKMSLMNTSTITRAVEISEDIFLDLARFDEIIADDGLNDNILIDVLGQVLNVGTVRLTDMSNNKTTKRLEVELRDANDQRVTLTLWDVFGLIVEVGNIERVDYAGNRDECQCNGLSFRFKLKDASGVELKCCVMRCSCHQFARELWLNDIDYGYRYTIGTSQVYCALRFWRIGNLGEEENGLISQCGCSRVYMNPEFKELDYRMFMFDFSNGAELDEFGEIIDPN